MECLAPPVLLCEIDLNSVAAVSKWLPAGANSAKGRSRRVCVRRQKKAGGCGSMQLRRRKKRECSGASGVAAGLGLTRIEKSEQVRVQIEGQVRAMQRCHAEDAL